MISYRYYTCSPSPDGHLTCDKDGIATCAPDFYGPPGCNSHCKVPSGQQHMHCDVNGTLVCNKDYFGENCSIFCQPPTHGVCNANGTIVCDDDYYADKCDTLCFTPSNGTGYCDTNGTLHCKLGMGFLYFVQIFFFYNKPFLFNLKRQTQSVTILIFVIDQF